MGFNNKFLLFIFKVIAKKNYGEPLCDAFPVLDGNYGLMVFRTRLTYIRTPAHSNVLLLFRLAPRKTVNFAIFILVDNVKFRWTAIWLPRPIIVRKRCLFCWAAYHYLHGRWLLLELQRELYCLSNVHCLFYSSSLKGLHMGFQDFPNLSFCSLHRLCMTKFHFWEISLVTVTHQPIKWRK